MADNCPSSATLEKPLGTEYELTTDKMWHAGYYGGLPIHADSPHVHEQALEIIQSHADKTSRIIDVGAGAGSFTKRLIDHGYGQVEAIELRAEAFQVPRVPVHALDLQTDWASRLPRPYDLLVALEVFEHLENPWHFARQCAEAVRPGGLAVLSTPNIESSRSRIEFLLRAEFRFFGERDFQRVGHVTSMTSSQIARVFAQAGMERLVRRYSRHKGIPRPGNPKKAYRAFLYALSYPFMKGTKHGETSIFLFRRTN